MGVSKNSGTPKWMVIVEIPIKMDDLGVPLFLETSIYCYQTNIKTSKHSIFPATIGCPNWMLVDRSKVIGPDQWVITYNPDLQTIYR